MKTRQYARRCASLCETREWDNEAGALDKAQGSCGRGTPSGQGFGAAIESKRRSARQASVACSDLVVVCLVTAACSGWHGAVDHFDAISLQFLIQRIAVVAHLSWPSRRLRR